MKSLAVKINSIILVSIIGIAFLLGTILLIYQSKEKHDYIDEMRSQLEVRLKPYLENPAWEFNYIQINYILEQEIFLTNFIKAIEYVEKVNDNEQELPPPKRIGIIKNTDGKLSELIYSDNQVEELSTLGDPFVFDIFKPPNDIPLGTVRIFFTNEAINKELLNSALTTLFLTLMTAVILSMILLFSFRKLVLNSISLLDTTMKNFSLKNFQVRVPVTSEDELGRLAGNFNRMADIIENYSTTLEDKVKERTKELKEINLYQSRFFSNISHEFRTPLTLLIGPLEAILSGNYGENLPKRHPVFQSLFHNAGRLIKLINNILSFSKIEEQKMTLSLKGANLSKLLNFYVSSIRGATDSKKINLIFNDNTTTPLISQVDSGLLEQALLNLLSNSLKFTRPGGSILVQLDPPNNSGYYKISVIDTGIGIPEEQINSIFERYRQLSDASQKQYEGSGIGLALVRDIVDLHNGRITVKSIPNEKTEFTIHLPFTTVADPWEVLEPEDEILSTYWLADFQEETDALPEPVEIGDKPKILVVDDSPSMRNFLTSILSRSYTVIKSNDGLEGLKAAKEHKPELIVSDVMMPNMDGLEMTKEVRGLEELKDTPIILLTAKAEEPTLLDGFHHGANDYMIKPFNSNELQARIKSHLETRFLKLQVERRNHELEEQKRLLEVAVIEKESAKQQLALSEKYFKELAEQHPSIIIEINQAGKISFINNTGKAFFEITELDKNVSFMDYLHPSHIELFKGRLENYLSGASSGLDEYTFVAASRIEKHGLFKSVPSEDGQGNRLLRISLVKVDSHLDLVKLPDERFYKDCNFTNREQEIFTYVMKGYSNKDIAEKLFVSEVTIKKHMANILQKTGTKNRKELKQMVQNTV